MKGTTVDIGQFTDDEIITPNTVRKRPCISEGGGCHIAATDKADANVFATAADAYKWVGSMGSRRDDSRSVDKHAYGVRLHDID